MTSKFSVPQNILDDLTARFPDLDIAQVEWSWEVSGKILEAEFSHDGMEYEIEYSISGLLISTETWANVDELPEAVTNAVQENFPEATVNSAERVEYSNGVVHLELDITHEGRDFEAHFREDGTLVLTGDDL